MPHFKLKIKVLEGQLEAPNLGLRSEDKKLLVSNVNIIFHCAATLRFDEELKSAINTNTCATQKILELAKQCPKLRVSQGDFWAILNLHKVAHLELSSWTV